jgi:hypothetical protein
LSTAQKRNVADVLWRVERGNAVVPRQYRGSVSPLLPAAKEAITLHDEVVQPRVELAKVHHRRSPPPRLLPKNGIYFIDPNYLADRLKLVMEYTKSRPGKVPRYYVKNCNLNSIPKIDIHKFLLSLGVNNVPMSMSKTRMCEILATIEEQYIDDDKYWEELRDRYYDVVEQQLDHSIKEKLRRERDN